MQNNKISDFFNKDYTYAIVGASKDVSKYGYKILKTLKDAQISVVPINPKEEEILGIKCYPSLMDLDFKVDVVDFVIPPKVTRVVLEEANKRSIRKVWFQPGSHDDDCLKYCDDNCILYLKDFCLMKTALDNIK